MHFYGPILRLRHQGRSLRYRERVAYVADNCERLLLRDGQPALRNGRLLTSPVFA